MTKAKKENNHAENDKEESALGDLFKKLSALGAAATEESIKNIIKDIPIAKDVAKDVVNNFVQNAKGAIGKVELEKIVDYVAEHYDLDIKANIKKEKRRPDE
jgi:cell division ATPase FtsA